MSSIRSGNPTPPALRQLGGVTLTRTMLGDAQGSLLRSLPRTTTAKGQESAEERRDPRRVPRLDAYA